MDWYLLKRYQQEIVYQGGYATYAYNRLNLALAEGEMERFWFYAQSFLISAANISKVLGVWVVGRRRSASLSGTRLGLGS
jgi:hypothetical protein